jgi:TolB-like protein
MTGDAEQEYFVDGMVEEITTAIAQLPWLFVIARNSAFTYKGKLVNVKQVARELGVRYVLEGSVRKAGNRVRITGQLIDTATSAHIWADRFDGALDDIFELQDRLASSVAGANRTQAAPIRDRARQSQAYHEPHRLRSLSARIGAVVSLYRRGLCRGGSPRPPSVGDRSVLRAGRDLGRLVPGATAGGVGSAMRRRRRRGRPLGATGAPSGAR